MSCEESSALSGFWRHQRFEERSIYFQRRSSNSQSQKMCRCLAEMLFKGTKGLEEQCMPSLNEDDHILARGSLG